MFVICVIFVFFFMKRLERKFRLYRRFELDIWGFVLEGEYVNKKIWNLVHFGLIKLFYSSLGVGFVDFDEITEFGERRVGFLKMKRSYLSKILVKLFYFGISNRWLNRSLAVSLRREGDFVCFFLLLLESRVVTLLYRSFFFFNFFQLKQLFLRGFVLVNRVSVRFFNERVRLGDIVHIGSPFVSMVRNNVLLKVSNKMVVRGLPRYLFVSYIFMFVLLCRYPRYMDVFFPVGFDVYRCLELL